MLLSPLFYAIAAAMRCFSFSFLITCAFIYADAYAAMRMLYICAAVYAYAMLIAVDICSDFIFICLYHHLFCFDAALLPLLL